MIALHSVFKAFKDKRVLHQIDLNVERGELFALIGPDAAGKTTLLRIMAGIYRADTGRVERQGTVGYLSQDYTLYADLSCYENMKFFATLYDVGGEEAETRIQRLLEAGHLWEFRERLSGQLSGGMKKKLALACALVARPPILLLDEPTTGVDPLSRTEFLQIVTDYRTDEGITVVMTTPYMAEADLADRVAFIQEGRIIALDTPARLRENAPFLYFAVAGADLFRLKEQLERAALFDSVALFGDCLHVSLDPAQVIPADLLALGSFARIEPSMEDVFFTLAHHDRS